MKAAGRKSGQAEPVGGRMSIQARLTRATATRRTAQRPSRKSTRRVDTERRDFVSLLAMFAVPSVARAASSQREPAMTPH